MSNILEWYEKQSDRLRLIFVIISGLALATSLTFSWTGNADKIAGFDPAWIAIVLCGVPIVLGAIVGVIKDHDITADVLVALALIGSLILKEFFAAGEVAFIMQIGSILEDFTSDRAKKGISKLIKLSPKKANLFVDGQIKIIEADQVKLGDILQIRAGESIPVDGKIIEGSTSIDQSAMTGEALSNHPLAKAIMDYNKSGLYEIKNHKTLAGSGIEFEIDGKKYVVGKVERDFKDAGKTSDAPSTNDASFSNISPDLEASSLVGLYCESKLLGIIFIQDALKENARKMVAQLKALKVRTVMLTGDNEKTARYVAAQTGLDDFKAGCSPEDKMNYIKNQEAQGNKVAMFGDGVNDSLALRSAFAGIAMGGIGSDVAIESADAVIVHDNLDAVPYLFKISRKTQGRITFNLCLSMVINFAAVALAISGILNTVWGALFHNCGSVLVVISAFLLLFYKGRD